MDKGAEKAGLKLKRTITYTPHTRVLMHTYI